VPRVSVIQTNFTAGEISPRLLGRVDVAKYNNAAKTMENVKPLVHGGGKRRGGTVFAAEAKKQDKLCRLIPFVYSRTQAFCLEFADGFIRFFTPAGQVLSGTVPYEIASPYLEADLEDLHFVQSADTMFLAHPNYPMRKLVRFSNTNWKLSVVDFAVPPSEEIGDRPATILTLGALTGAGVSATASAAAFIDSDVGRYIEAGTGRALITAYTSTTVVTVTVVDNFAALAQASGTWKITESGKTALTPSVAGPEGVGITVTGAANVWKNTAQVNHVGKFIELNGGLVEITAYSSATVVTGIVRTVLTGTAAAPSESWALRENVWNAVDGYPRAVSLFEQRLIAAGTTAYPQTIWGSRVGEYNNFADGASDDDGFAFTIAADQVNSVEHLAQLRELIPLTFGGEFSMSGGEGPLTPTNVRIRSQTTYGASACRPVRVGNEIVWVSRGGRKVRSSGYRFDSDSYAAPDLSILAEHITDGGEDGGIFEMAYTQEPDQLVWMIRGDGVLVYLALDRDQDAVGFSRATTLGYFDSVAVIPNGDHDQAWVATERTIDGNTVRYIEYFDDDRNTDCCITGTSGGAGSTVWTGLDHLEGETVQVVQDGFYGGEHTVESGTITLAIAANSVEIGLPYRSTLVPVPPEVPTGQGTGQGNAMSVHEIVARFQDTIGAKVNGQTVPTRNFAADGVLDEPLVPFSGDKRVENLGWEKGGTELVTFTQDLPFSMTVLACIYRMTVND
jgi:hypothetical protein